MDDKLTIVLKGEAQPIDVAMSLIGVAFSTDAGEWASKYGTDFENDVFLMKRYCWCERNDGACLWCLHGDHPDFDRLLLEKFGTQNYQQFSHRHYYDPPQFWYKPSDFRLTWYKYIGRDMSSNKDELPGDWLYRIFATHPKGMKPEQAFERLQASYEETNRMWADIAASVGAKLVREP